MAMTVLGIAPDAPDLDVKILATDIDPAVVAEGAAGFYRETALSGLSRDLGARWFETHADRGEASLRAGEALRTLVSFRELNLIADWPMSGRFDAIFCRNVAIYFEDSTQERVWSRLASRLQPGGILYIGHSERITGEAAALLTPVGVTAYRLTGAVQ